MVIDEIRQVVADGFQRLQRGGIEVGGVLYGTREDRIVRILAMREIACEHARGPTFHLSDNDRAALTAQLARDKEDMRLEGLLVVGWFLSHTRSDVTLQQSDLDTYNAFFPEPWQVTMVVHPGRAGAMRAGFFVREPDGTVKGERSYQEFNFPDRLAGVLDRAPRERRPLMDPPPADRLPSARYPVRPMPPDRAADGSNRRQWIRASHSMSRAHATTRPCSGSRLARFLNTLPIRIPGAKYRGPSSAWWWRRCCGGGRTEVLLGPQLHAEPLSLADD